MRRYDRYKSAYLYEEQWEDHDHGQRMEEPDQRTRQSIGAVDQMLLQVSHGAGEPCESIPG